MQCGAESCYDKSKRKQEICLVIFDANGLAVADHFSKKLSLTIPFNLALVLLWAFYILFTLAINSGSVSRHEFESKSQDTLRTSYTVHSIQFDPYILNSGFTVEGSTH